MKHNETIWNTKKGKDEEMPENIKQFLNELDELCQKHDISISHEDKHGGFIFQKYNQENIEWIKEASKDF